MIPVLCHGCGQRGKVASIPDDLVCVACLSDDIDLDDRTAAIGGDPSLSMGLLPSGVPDQDRDMGLLGETQRVTETIRCSTCFHQFSQTVTDPSAPMLPCPKCGADTTTAAGTTTASLDTRLPEEQTLQRSLETKPQSQLTGEEEIDLARLRRQQRGPIDGSDGKNPYSDSNPYRAKVEQIAQAVLASNPGMPPVAARRVAESTLRRYPKVLG